VDELHAAPGNPGIAALATCHPVRADDREALGALAVELRVDLVVVGPEAPLVTGLADELRRRGIFVFGPSAAAAQIEGSKAFAKDVMDAAGVPSARMLDRAGPPCVVKLDGLAAGKGVWVCRTQAELDEALAAAEEPFHVEELLEGPASRSPLASRPSCSHLRATTSASATAKPARTPAGWARSRRCPTSLMSRRRRSSRRSTSRSCASSRGAARRSTAVCTAG